MTMKYTSKEINEFLRKFDDNDADKRWSVKNFTEDSGKVVPYIGWFWREVDFEKPFQLGYCPEQSGQDTGEIVTEGVRHGFVGFMRNNKWFYPEWMVTEEQRKEIVARLVGIIDKPTQKKFQNFFDYMQTLRPENLQSLIDQWKRDCEEFDELMKR